MELMPALRSFVKLLVVVIPYEEFLLVQEALEDLEDLRTLRSEKEESGHLPTKSLDEVICAIQD